MPRIIDLERKCQFRVLLHPVRHEIIHLLRLAGKPLSANGVAKRMNLSPIAAQGHLKKLVDMGVVLQREMEVHDRKVVLYALDDVEIRLHLGRKDTFQGEREAMAANIVDGTFRGLINATHQYPENELDQHCLLRFGAFHLSPQEREELFALIIKYLETHNAHLDQDDEHWEYVFMTYRAPDESTL